MFNNHFTRTLSVLTSARVFMRREAIPPLRGGAVQALQNIQTTLRDHPYPASRPMTLGHFTSWRADDRGYYSGPRGRRRRRRRRRRRDDARMWPAWYFLQGIVAPGRRANVIEGVREIRRAVGHIFGANLARMVLFARDCGPWQARDGVERACESGSRELLCHKC